MTVYYLDSSAWVKRYVFEVGSDFVGNLFSRKDSLACSALGLVEITATLARKRKAGDLGEADLVLLIARSRKDWEGFYQIPLFSAVVDSALSLARTEALRGADALHLGSALLLATFLDERQSELVFVGSDRDLNAAAGRLGLTVVDPGR